MIYYVRWILYAIEVAYRWVERVDERDPAPDRRAKREHARALRHLNKRIRDHFRRFVLLCREVSDAYEGEMRPVIDVTDDCLDAPDGARVGDYERHGDQWWRVPGGQ